MNLDPGRSKGGSIKIVNRQLAYLIQLTNRASVAKKKKLAQHYYYRHSLNLGAEAEANATLNRIPYEEFSCVRAPCTWTRGLTWEDRISNPGSEMYARAFALRCATVYGLSPVFFFVFHILD